MSRHLYDGLAGRVRHFTRRFGAAELLLVPARAVLSPFIIPCLAPRTFCVNGVHHACFYHRYNATWCNERCVEVPLARAFLAAVAPSAVLEIGHVLSHYAALSHTVVDKHEHAPGVINGDVRDYRPGRTFDRIVSISTFEHIGFDDEAGASDDGGDHAIAQAIAATRALLAPGGVFWMSAPLGYNPALDALIERGELGAQRILFLRRTGSREWEQVSWEDVRGARYMRPWPFANALCVAEFDSPLRP